MTNIAVTREFNVKLESDFYLRKNLLGKSNEARVSVDFKSLDEYISSLELDLGYVASGLFACEGLLRKGIDKLNGSVGILVQSESLRKVAPVLEDLLSFTLKVRPKIRILRVKTAPINPRSMVRVHYFLEGLIA